MVCIGLLLLNVGFCQLWKSVHSIYGFIGSSSIQVESVALSTREGVCVAGYYETRSESDFKALVSSKELPVVLPANISSPTWCDRIAIAFIAFLFMLLLIVIVVAVVFLVEALWVNTL